VPRWRASRPPFGDVLALTFTSRMACRRQTARPRSTSPAGASSRSGRSTSSTPTWPGLAPRDPATLFRVPQQDSLPIWPLHLAGEAGCRGPRATGAERWSVARRRRARRLAERKSSAIAPEGLPERLRVPSELRVGHREPIPLLLVDGEDGPTCAQRGVHLGLDGAERGEAIPSLRARCLRRRAHFLVPAKCRSLVGGSFLDLFGARAARAGLRRVIRSSMPSRDEELWRRRGQPRRSYSLRPARGMSASFTHVLSPPRACRLGERSAQRWVRLLRRGAPNITRSTSREGPHAGYEDERGRVQGQRCGA
jgi:hypothetical protein